MDRHVALLLAMTAPRLSLRAKRGNPCLLTPCPHL